MAYLLCEDCGISFRPHIDAGLKYPVSHRSDKAIIKPGMKCPDCGRTNTHIEEDDEE